MIESNIKKKFVSDIFIRLITQILLESKGIILIPLIVKMMGELEYGAWVQMTLTGTLLVPIFLLRLDIAGVRYLASKDHKIIAQDFFSMLTLIGGCLIVISGSGFLFRGQIANYLFRDKTKILYVNFFIVFLFVRTFFTFFHNYYRIFIQIKKYSIIQLITIFVSLGIAIFGVLLGKGLVWILFSFIVVEASFSLWILIDIIHQVGFPPSIKIMNLGSYLRYSIPTIPNSLLFWVIDSSDRYLILYMLGLKEVGIYSASYSIGKFANFFLKPISFVLFPNLSKLWEEQNIIEVKRYIQNSLNYYFLFSIPSIFGICYLAPAILRGLATQEYVTSRLLILFIVLGIFCIGIYQIYIFIIHINEKTKYIPLFFFIGASINLALNFILIPKIGMIGAAFSTFLAYFIQMIVIIWFSYKIFLVNFDFTFIAKTIVASTGMFFLLTLFEPNSLLIILAVPFIGTASYFSFMFLLKGMTYKDLQFFKSIVKNIVYRHS